MSEKSLLIELTAKQHTIEALEKVLRRILEIPKGVDYESDLAGQVDAMCNAAEEALKP